MVNGWVHIAQGMILPPTCVLCGDRGQSPTIDMCQACIDDLSPNRSPCRRCAVPLPGAESDNLLCTDCLKKSPSFDRVKVPFQYEYPLDHLIRAFKYDKALAYGRVLGTLLAQYASARTESLPQVLLPVPLHADRLRDRGFNQAFELARYISQALSIPVDNKLCIRTKETDDQTELTAADRRRNLRGAFRLTRKPAFAHVAIIDDVVTTGSTAGELARVLKEAGIRVVEVWAIARASHLPRPEFASQSQLDLPLAGPR